MSPQAVCWLCPARLSHNGQGSSLPHSPGSLEYWISLTDPFSCANPSAVTSQVTGRPALSSSHMHHGCPKATSKSPTSLLSSPSPEGKSRQSGSVLCCHRPRPTLTTHSVAPAFLHPPSPHPCRETPAQPSNPRLHLFHEALCKQSQSLPQLYPLTPHPLNSLQGTGPESTACPSLYHTHRCLFLAHTL